MYLISLLLPLYDNDGTRFPRDAFRQVASELTDRFGGLTAHTRAPAEGLWQPGRDQSPERDDIIIYEVIVDSIDRDWWIAYRRELEHRFRQEHVIVRSHEIELL